MKCNILPFSIRDDKKEEETKTYEEKTSAKHLQPSINLRVHDRLLYTHLPIPYKRCRKQKYDQTIVLADMHSLKSYSQAVGYKLFSLFSPPNFQFMGVSTTSNVSTFMSSLPCTNKGKDTIPFQFDSTKCTLCATKLTGLFHV